MLDTHQTTCGLTHGGGDALAEATGGEGGVALWYHPRCKVGHEVQALQGHHAGSHQIARREEGILQVVDHRLVGSRDCREVVVLYIDDNIKEKKDVEAHEV